MADRIFRPEAARGIVTDTGPELRFDQAIGALDVVAAGFARGEWRAHSEGPAELRFAVERDGEELEILIQTLLMVR